MPIAQILIETLEEANRALIALDLNKLESLEVRIAELATSASANRSNTIGTVLAKQQLLNLILQQCRSNLNALHRVHGRNSRDQWVH